MQVISFSLDYRLSHDHEAGINEEKKNVEQKFHRKKEDSQFRRDPDDRC